MKTILRFAMMAIMLLTTTMLKATDVQYLTIMVQGKSVSFALSDKPVITYQNNYLVVTTAKETIEFSVTDIAGTVFEETSTAIRHLMSGGKPQVKDGFVCFSDLIPGTLVQLFAIDGRNMSEVKADADGTAQMNLLAFPKGTYMLKVEKQTIKIINK